MQVPGTTLSSHRELAQLAAKLTLQDQEGARRQGFPSVHEHEGGSTPEQPPQIPQVKEQMNDRRLFTQPKRHSRGTQLR